MVAAHDKERTQQSDAVGAAGDGRHARQAGAEPGQAALDPPEQTACVFHAHTPRRT
jgi:hypothetical protein